MEIEEIKMDIKLITGDCIEEMKKLPENSVDAIITDPPYFLINNSGSGFMGKDWESLNISKIYDLLWKSEEFVNLVERFFLQMKIESNGVEENIVQESVNIKKIQKNFQKKSNVNVLSVEKNLKEVLAILNQRTNSVQGIVLTKQEVLDMLQEMSKRDINLKELKNISKNAIFVIPFIKLPKGIKNIVPENALKNLIKKECVEKEIHLTLMEEIRIRGVIEGMIGIKLGKKFMNEMDGYVESVEKDVEKRKYNVITLNHIERQKIIKWITLLLFVLNATTKLKENLNLSLMQEFHYLWSKECKRVLKPGGYLLSFGGTRTYHRMTCGIEDAGFEIRDTIMYLYGSGFPKSLNIGKNMEKQIDNFISFINYDLIWKNQMIKEKLEGAFNVGNQSKKNQIGVGCNIKKEDFVLKNVLESIQKEEELLNVKIVENLSLEANPILKNIYIVLQNVGQKQQISKQNVRFVVKRLQNEEAKLNQINIFIVECNVKELLREKIMDKIKEEGLQKIWLGKLLFSKKQDINVLCVELIESLKHIILNQLKISQNLDMKYLMDNVSATNVIITKSIMECLILFMGDILKKEIKKYKGEGTALKPAFEPIVVARKPLSEKNVALNVLKYGTGGINIDACRIPHNEIVARMNKPYIMKADNNFGGGHDKRTGTITCSQKENEGRFPANLILDEEAGRILDEQSGISKSSDAIRNNNNNLKNYTCYGNFKDINTNGFNDKGGASRFFYCAKASKSERMLDGYITIKLKKDELLNELWKEESMGLVELLKKVISEWGITNLSIEEFGENISVQFHKDFLFIIRMEINKIIELKTLNLLQHLPIKEYIQVVNSEKEFGGKNVQFVKSGNQSQKSFGISQKKGGYPMENVENAILEVLLKIKKKEGEQSYSNHPTHKPIKLMEYLVKLVSTEGATILDLFMGSGTTGIACVKLNRNFIGIEKEPDYMKIAKARINYYNMQRKLNEY